MTTPKCFCIQEPSLERDRITGRLIPKDLSSAVRYGRVEFILDQEDKPSLTPGPCMRKITNALQEFRPDDYLFHAGGDQLALLLVGAALRKAGFNEVNYLRWEREIDAETGRRTGGGYYVPVTVRLNF